MITIYYLKVAHRISQGIADKYGVVHEQIITSQKMIQKIISDVSG